MKNFFRMKTLLLCFAIGAYFSAYGRAIAQETTSQPAVVVAVAPNYFPFALASHTSGEVVVEVKIDSKGLVTDARGLSGKPILIADSKYVARRWKFEPSEQSAVRTARLTFVYRLVPKETRIEELLPIFKLPYRVEIAHVISEERVSP
jgi:TonB family protein